MPDLQGLKSMEATQTGEATPQQNTAQPLNPLPLDTVALAKLLETRFSETPTKAVEEPEPAAASADEPVAEESASETAETGEATPVEDPAEEETSQQTEDATEDEPAGVQKRINKLVAQKKEAAAKAEALERELNEARTKLEALEQQAAVPQAAATTDNPFSDIWDEAKLSDEYRKARELKRWCEDNADGCEVGGKEYSADEIKAIRRRVEDALDVHIPTRHQFLATYKQVRPVAESAYPWWKDRSNPTYSEAQQVLRQMPQLASFPDYQIAIGDFLEGRKARMEREKSAKAPVKAPVKVAPKQPAAPKASPVKSDKANDAARSAKKAFNQSGSTADLSRLLQHTLLKS
jgi:hypothetical protein